METANRMFSSGDLVKRVDRNAEGEVQTTFFGRVSGYDTGTKPPFNLYVRWSNGSQSHRPEIGLEKADKSELPAQMTAADIESAKAALGAMWGLPRPLHNSELARALRLGGRDPGRSVQDWLTGSTNITGPVSVAIELMLAGGLPPDPMADILRKAM